MKRLLFWRLLILIIVWLPLFQWNLPMRAASQGAQGRGASRPAGRSSPDKPASLVVPRFTNGFSAVTVTTPPHAVGAVNIDLTPTSGSAFSKSNAFAYPPTIFSDNTLVARVTASKAQHITELRQAVDALRAVAGLGPAPGTDPALVSFNTSIKAVHITELRFYLEDAAGRLGYPPVSYSDTSLGSGFVIKLAHIEELRRRIRAIAG